MIKKVSFLVAALCLMAIMPSMALAHEHRDVHEYNFVVGFIQEPAFEGLLNAVSVRITKMPDAESHGQGMHGESEEDEKDDENGEMSMSMSMPGHGHGGMPVEGLEGTLAVEVTHVASGVKRQMALSPGRADAGHYTAYFIPTASGQYIFRFMGSIEGQAVDEVFESGPGRFADIEPADALQFPESAASLRELEAGLRGALDSAQQTELASASAQSGASTAMTLAIVGIALGVVGVAVGGVGMALALRRKN